MRKFFTPALIYFLFIASISGQATNDECNTAIPIVLINGCSDAAAYTNEEATPSNLAAPFCFTGGHNDVWFSFVPEATDVAISVIGATGGGGAGGSLVAPEAALYTGSCGGALFEEECESAEEGSNAIELYKGGLVIGQQYFIRIQGQDGETGTFQLCINNFNPPVVPGSDCSTASLLCNKESFIVQSVVGAGADPTEANGAPCFGSGQVESNSTWFTWTAANDGDLTFTLTPTVLDDDLDFVVYELPNGVNDCSEKRILRCMASGDFDFPSRCMGPTGLRADEPDESEPGGCGIVTQNNFIAPLQMRQGRSYALMINNFSSSGVGFLIEFGGTGQFQGPEADFVIGQEEVCTGQPVRFNDASTFLQGDIVGWQWDFGPDATPSSTSGQGGHEVSFNRPGEKTVVLTVTSEDSCQVTVVRTLSVVCCPDQFGLTADIANSSCPDTNDGRIDLTIQNNFPPLAYQWSTGADSEDLQDLEPGNYEVTITDLATCDTSFSFTISGPEPFEFDTLITRPTCGGAMDGSLELITSGGNEPYEYSLDGGAFSTNGRFEGLASNVYSVIMRDSNNCEVAFEISVVELELELDSSVASTFPPSCNGFSDGRLEAVIGNGRGPYEYNWADGRGFTTENILQDLPAGTYQLTARDADLCQGTFEFQLNDFPPVVVSFDVMEISCAGAADGRIEALATGGVGKYTYRWSNGQSAVTISDLDPDQYTLTLADANNCQITGSVELLDPSIIDLEVTQTIDIICFGDNTGTIALRGTGGTPPYLFSIDGVSFQQADRFDNLPAADFEVFIQDAGGCLDSVMVTLNQPPPLLVDAGEDQIIDLGEFTDLRAEANNPDVRYAWMASPEDSLSCRNCPAPRVGPVLPTWYTVTVTDAFDCTATDSVFVDISEDRPVFIPNVFSPNRDGVNDYFTLYGGAAVEQIDNLKIFDRWGNLVFERSDMAFGFERQGWNGRFDGEAMPMGTYVYMAEVRFINGSVIRFEGDITLTR